MDAERTVVTTTAMLAPGPAPAEPKDHYLVGVEGACAGLRWRLSDRAMRVGRHESCDIPIADSQVSSRHCELTLNPAGAAIRVTDLGSTNGTFVDGVRVQGTAALGVGGLLQFGAEVMRHDHLTRAEAARWENERQDLDKARAFVESLLPARLVEGPVRTDWCFVPCAQLGGDALGYQSLSEDTFAAYVLDVSGHGVGAAMLSVSVLNVLRQRALPGCDFHDPAQVLRCLNDMFPMEAHEGMVFTVWYGVYDRRDATLRYASAGHHPAYLVSGDRLRMEALRTRNLVIGAAPSRAFVVSRTRVEPGSTLYVFTDGVFEVQDARGGQRTLNDFLPLLQQPFATSGGEAARILDAVRAGARPGAFDDDFALLAVTFMPSA